jgi:stage II sporulation protein D
LRLDGARYRGEFILESLPGGKLRVVNAVGLEGYLKGVLPAELGRPGEKGFQALKAQAVAARSYTLYQMNQRREGPYDLLPSEADQVYLGMDGEDARANEAVDATWGIAALYKGKIIRANYSSTCGGRTADASAVWPEGGRFGFLRARRDRHDGDDFCSGAPYYRWEEVWDCRGLNEVVRKNLWRCRDELKGKDPGPVERMKILSRTPSGRVAELGVWTRSGRYIVRGDEVRWVLRRTNGAPLRSAFIGSLRKENRDGRCVMILQGAGFGHGVGLCQTGAMEMSRQGYNYLQILRHYYRDIDIQQIYDGHRGRNAGAGR